MFCLDIQPLPFHTFAMGPTPEETVAVLGFFALVGIFLYRFIRWVIEAPRTPDPWTEDTDAAVNGEEAVPVCHHCLTPQQHHGWFCPACGATVGPYANYMPYIYIFSEGEVMRAGVSAHLRRSALVILGFMLLSLSTFASTGVLIAVLPIYWFLLFRNLRKGTEAVDA